MIRSHHILNIVTCNPLNMKFQLSLRKIKNIKSNIAFMNFNGIRGNKSSDIDMIILRLSTRGQKIQGVTVKILIYFRSHALYRFFSCELKKFVSCRDRRWIEIYKTRNDFCYQSFYGTKTCFLPALCRFLQTCNIIILLGLKGCN